MSPLARIQAWTRHVLWRHDIDFSVHRALRLAQIESEHRVNSTYFVNLHCEFYNLLEAEIFERFKAIMDLGHWPGLHFDTSFYGGFESESELASKLSFERGLVEQLIGRPVEVFSFHNPEATEVERFDADRIADMVNASGIGIRECYAYVSDSNGYWRHRRLPDVLEEGRDEFLQVLTHPEWWQPVAMSPRERIQRCIEGRAAAGRAFYQEALQMEGREDIG